MMFNFFNRFETTRLRRESTILLLSHLAEWLPFDPGKTDNGETVTTIHPVTGIAQALTIYRETGQVKVKPGCGCRFAGIFELYVYMHPRQGLRACRSSPEFVPQEQAIIDRWGGDIL